MGTNLVIEMEMKNCAEKVWSYLKQFATVFPKAMPHLYERIDVLKGDGKTPGSILVYYFKAPELKYVSTAKAELWLVDEEKKTLGFRFAQGEPLNSKSSLSVTPNPKDAGGCIVTYSAEFDESTPPNPDFYIDFTHKIYQDLDAYISSQP